MPSEFEFILNIKEKYGLNRIGDDCAVLPKDSKTDLVITADMLVEDIDFRLDWTTPEQLGHKSLAVSLSDIAAMGATPKWAMLSIGAPEQIWKGGFVRKLYVGWFGLADLHGVELIGGDISRTPDRLVIDSIVAGSVPKGKAVRRSGARPGDFIFVTGSVGGAAGGLQLLESGSRYGKLRGRKKQLVTRQLMPAPRMKIARDLGARVIATSMIDISDGLSADLYHICDASGVGATINLDTLPIDDNLDGSLIENVELALSGGEDFELLFTSKQKNIRGRFSDDLTRIGEVTKHTGRVEVIANGERRLLPRSGFRHF
jgi:thiamine-monophosphate kinase